MLKHWKSSFITKIMSKTETLFNLYIWCIFMSCLSYRGQFLCFSRDPWSCVCVWLACWWGVYVIACLLPSRLPAILGSSKLQSGGVWLGCVVLNHCFSPLYSFPLFSFVLLSPSPTGVSSNLYPNHLHIQTILISFFPSHTLHSKMFCLPLCVQIH